MNFAISRVKITLKLQGQLKNRDGLGRRSCSKGATEVAAVMTSSPFKSSFSCCFHPALLCLVLLGLLSPLSPKFVEMKAVVVVAVPPYFDFEGGSLYSYACNVGLTKIGKQGASFEVTLYFSKLQIKTEEKKQKNVWPLFFIRQWKKYRRRCNPRCSQC